MDGFGPNHSSISCLEWDHETLNFYSLRLSQLASIQTSNCYSGGLFERLFHCMEIRKTLSKYRQLGIKANEAPTSRCREVMSVLSSKGKDISKGFSLCAHFPKCLIMVLDYEQPLGAVSQPHSYTARNYGVLDWIQHSLPSVYESLPKDNKKADKSLHEVLDHFRQTSLVWTAYYLTLCFVFDVKHLTFSALHILHKTELLIIVGPFLDLFSNVKYMEYMMG